MEACSVIWFWTFLFYSLMGFFLEVAYARSTGGDPNRKCLLLLPLCPVYGLGACAILLLPGWVSRSLPALFLLGGLTATAAEYLTALFYHYVLHVSFWDYRGLPGSLQGRVCLPFSLAWGLLSVVLVRWFHPLVSPWLAAIPAPVSWAALAVFLCDAVFSAVLLRRTGSKACLNWLTA